MASSLAEQKARLVADLEVKNNLVAKREDAVRKVGKELVKANEIIRKYMEQNKTEHQKVKLAAKVADEQEKVT